MTTIVMSTHKLNPLAICVTSLSGAKIKLRYHITSSHAEKEAFQCDIKSVGIQCTILRKTCLCGYTTAKEFKLDKHGESCGKTLDPNSIDHCKLCHKTFLTKKSLNRHSRLYNNKNKSDTESRSSLCVVSKKLCECVEYGEAPEERPWTHRERLCCWEQCRNCYIHNSTAITWDKYIYFYDIDFASSKHWIPHLK